MQSWPGFDVMAGLDPAIAGTSNEVMAGLDPAIHEATLQIES